MYDKGQLARRMAVIQPFHVMDILARARHFESQGRSIVHMEIGEPDFVTAAPVIEAGIRALRTGKTFYTPALGLSELRQAISEYYRRIYRIDVPVQRIVVTPGASGALQLALGVLVDPGDEVLISDPGYPCNRHLVEYINGIPVGIPVTPNTSFQLAGDMIKKYGNSRVKAAMVASPANPTGTTLSEQQLGELIIACRSTNISLIVDEIYHGLVYGDRLTTALSLSEDAFVVNSFSKYFGMTGWRVGWLVVPEPFVRAVDKLAQNIFLAASTIAQYAAVAALQPETLSIMDERCMQFRRRRDYLLAELPRLGFEIPVHPDGAFYIYADCHQHANDSLKFCEELLETAGVAITPGCDFGSNMAERYVRFAYTTQIENLKQGIYRLDRYLSTRRRAC